MGDSIRYSIKLVHLSNSSRQTVIGTSDSCKTVTASQDSCIRALQDEILMREQGTSSNDRSVGVRFKADWMERVRSERLES